MRDLIAAMLQPTAYDHPVQSVELIETHISWILLTGEYAYKLRKPVNLGFVDFSTPERRRWFSLEELRLNRRLAPELYLDVRSIHGPLPNAHLGGTGDVIDTVVMMRQFPQAQLLPAVLERGELRAEHLEQLAQDLARFHAAAAVATTESGFGSASAVTAPALENLKVLDQHVPERLEPGTLTAWTWAEAARLAEHFEQRLLRGAVREGHGDLHLGNMLLGEGRIRVFDCLEFSPALRWIDVMSDLAFLAMDLRQRGRRDLAGVVLDRWLEATGDYAGLRAWRWYGVYRALVRAKVAALRLSQGSGASVVTATLGQLGRYLDVATAAAVAPQGQLVICHGVSGSGKSHLARRLCRQLGWIRLCSDIERRRLFGRWGGLIASTPWAGDPYRPEVSERLYGDVLLNAAQLALDAGESVIVDATFLRRSDRTTYAQLAQRYAARFLILDCRVDHAVAEARINQRQQQGCDPSEADLDVLRLQWEQREPLGDQERTQAVVVDHNEELGGDAWQRLLTQLDLGDLPSSSLT
ncbi:MAG: AAA family ATPase [Synechococcaceae cyanobacterium]|nr:AAA family ATPase [Synechococcaceae cyanobacterium]